MPNPTPEEVKKILHSLKKKKFTIEKVLSKDYEHQKQPDGTVILKPIYQIQWSPAVFTGAQVYFFEHADICWYWATHVDKITQLGEDQFKVFWLPQYEWEDQVEGRDLIDEFNEKLEKKKKKKKKQKKQKANKKALKKDDPCHVGT